MNALHVLGADHFWSNVPMFVMLGLFLFLAAIALRTRSLPNADPKPKSDPKQEPQ
jgi:hypothetical protein